MLLTHHEPSASVAIPAHCDSPYERRQFCSTMCTISETTGSSRSELPSSDVSHTTSEAATATATSQDSTPCLQSWHRPQMPHRQAGNLHAASHTNFPVQATQSSSMTLRASSPPPAGSHTPPVVPTLLPHKPTAHEFQTTRALAAMAPMPQCMRHSHPALYTTLRCQHHCTWTLLHTPELFLPLPSQSIVRRRCPQ